MALKEDPYYWYLSIAVLLLGFEGVFTLAIKEDQEWRFFSPCVFLYLARYGHNQGYHLYITSTYHSVCPAIWLIELDKLGTRLAIKEAREAFLSLNSTTFPPTTTQGIAVLV